MCRGKSFYSQPGRILDQADSAIRRDLSQGPRIVETLASTRELSAVLIGVDRTSRLLSGWRKELVGDELLRLLPAS